MQMKTVVIAGNPKPQSRTLDAGLRLAGMLGVQDPTILDVATLGTGLLGWGDEKVRTAVEQVASMDLAIIASPTFKATYSGLLKLFLDQFAGGDGLRDVVAVPLMLGAGQAHSLAPELHLKPVLVELGAICPVPALYQLDRTYTEDPLLADWVTRWSPVISSLTTKPKELSCH